MKFRVVVRNVQQKKRDVAFPVLIFALLLAVAATLLGLPTV